MSKVICRPHDLHRDYRVLAALAKGQDWSITLTTRGHVRFQPPKGRAVITSGTPSDWRAVKNFKAQLRKAGLTMTTETTTKPSTPPTPTLSEPRKRTYRAGLAEAIHTVLSSTPGQSMSSVDICLRLSSRYPKLKSTDLYQHLRKLVTNGDIQSTDRGYYRALTLKAPLEQPVKPVEQPIEQPEPSVEDEGKALLERFLTLMQAFEGYVGRVTKRNEQFIKLKQALHAVQID